MLTALLLGPMLATGVTRADEATAPDWTDQKIEAAFHDVLAHGDLSDIDFLAKTLGLKLEVMQWETPVRKERLETQVMATGVPSYLAPYNLRYDLTRNTEDGTTRIKFFFYIKSCPDLERWGREWNHPVQAKTDGTMDGEHSSATQSIPWQQSGEGIVLQRTQVDEACFFTLEQTRVASLSIPKPPTTPPGSGTELRDQMIDLAAAGDLRDYQRTARILHTEMSTHSELRGQLLYDGGAMPERIIPGTDTRFFLYEVDDTGWFDAGHPVFMHRRAPRTAMLWISVDPIANCISPESLEARARQVHTRFIKETSKDSGWSLRTIQQGNELSLSYTIRDSCITTFQLNQTTDVAHSPR